MYGRVTGVTVVGVGGHPVVVEAFVGRGLPSLDADGAPRRRGAGRARPHPPRRRARGVSSGRCAESWSTSRRRTCGRRVPGSTLPIAVAVLAATAQVPARALDGVVFFGEVSLRGEIRSHARRALGRDRRRSRRRRRHRRARGQRRRGRAGGRAARGRGARAPTGGRLPARDVGARRTSPPRDPAWRPPAVDLADVRGQHQARRALEIAAAGGHNLLLVGSPGAGKTMLARRLPSILPPLTRTEALEATQLHSVAGLLTGRGLLVERPFRSPHHTVSTAGLLGGGSTVVRPGEVSLAHHGVLFLDEVTEFRRDAIEALRQPLEDGHVVVTRAGGSVAFPARCTLVAAANPCPCGFHGDPARDCRCRDDQVARYRAKLSGPLLDRIDLRLSVPRLTKHELLGADGGRALRGGPGAGGRGAANASSRGSMGRGRRATRICRVRWRGVSPRSPPRRNADRLGRRGVGAVRPRVRSCREGRADHRGPRGGRRDRASGTCSRRSSTARRSTETSERRAS